MPTKKKKKVVKKSIKKKEVVKSPKKEKKKERNPHFYMPSRGMLAFKGLIAILIGVALWTDYLTLAQTIAVVLILVGLKKLYYSLS